LQHFLHTRERALHWRSLSVIYDDLAMGALARAKRNGLPREELQAAKDWQQQALALSPADPYGWARLAFLDLLTGDRDDAARALAHSIETGPHEPRLLVSRIGTAMLLGDRLDPAFRAQLPATIREAWAHNPEALAQAAREGHYTAQVEAALADQPEELTKFRRMAEN
jgi:predicted Zn-dependent protease